MHLQPCSETSLYTEVALKITCQRITPATMSSTEQSKRSSRMEGKPTKNRTLLQLSKFQRRVKKNKSKKSIDKESNTSADVVVEEKTAVQTKKFDRFFADNYDTNLTVSTTMSSYSSSFSQPQLNHSFDYPISRWSSQESYSDINNSSMDESFTTFGTSVKAPDDKDLFNEWLRLYACSAENAASYTDDEAEESRKYRSSKGTRRHSNAGVLIYGNPSDLLSEQYTLGSSTETMSTLNHRIPTPPNMAGVSCVFDFNMFGAEMFKSVGESLCQIKGQTKNNIRLNDEDGECSDDNIGTF